IDSCSERLGDALEDLASEAARDERGEAFVVIGGAARDEGLEHHAGLAAQTEERAAQDRHQVCRSHQGEAVGNRDEASAPDDEGPAELLLSADEARVETEARDEVHRPRFFGEEGIGGRFKGEAVATDGFERAAGPRSSLEDDYFEGELVSRRKFAESMRCGESGDPCADYCDV